MRTETYTKAVLSVIAILLAVIASRPYFSPDAMVSAQGPFAGVQYQGPNISFFDTRTGEPWMYQGGQLTDKYSRWPNPHPRR